MFAARSALVAFVFALLVNLPWIGRGELESEEARRALPAEAMLAAPAGDAAAWYVPRLWGEPYLAKPPLFPWWVALHEVALERSGLHAALRVERGERGWWPPARVSPYAVRLAALSSAALLAALVAAVAARAAAPGREFLTGVLAGLFTAAAPEMLSKAPLGEIETTLALWCAVAALGLGASALRGGVGWPIVGALGLAAAQLAKGPVALVFSLAPAFTFAVARVGWRAALLRVGLPGVVGVAGFLWWPILAGRALAEGDAATRWAAELARGGSGGVVTYLADRGRLVVGLLGGFAPASLFALVLLRRGRSGAAPATDGGASWRANPLLVFALHGLVVGGLVLLLWPGVRPRYGLPLVSFAAVLGAHALVSGARLQGGRRLVRFVGGLGALLAVVAAVLHTRAASDGRVEPLSASLVALLAAAGAAGVLAAWRGARASGAALVALGIAAFVGARSVQLGVLDGLRTDHRRAAAAAHLESLAPTGLTTDVWGWFNDLYYLEVPVRFAPRESVAPGEVFLTYSELEEPLTAPSWTALPFFEEPHWSGPRPRAFPNAALWRRANAERAAEVRPGD
jgi:4-amino-4-deoxy-L-arabinose transferase-like glycosyltransferase